MKWKKANKVDLKNAANIFSFEQQNNHQSKDISQEIRPPFHLHENSLIDIKDTAETAIQIIAAKKPVTNPALCRYLHENRISGGTANAYCVEVDFKIENKNELFTAIGFKNNAGGYELRNDFLCLNSSPKYISYIVNSNTFSGLSTYFSPDELAEFHPPINMIRWYNNPATININCTCIQSNFGRNLGVSLF